MAQDRTAGFDLLIQISEAELNAQVAAAFAAGALFPTSFSTPVAAMGVSGRIDLNLGTPVVDLDRPRPQMGFTVPFLNSQFEITAPLALTLAPLAGTLVIVDAVQMRSQPGTQQAVLDFTAGAPGVTVSFDAATRSLLAPLLATVGATVAQAEAEFANQVRNQLVGSVQRLPLTPPIAVADDSDPLTPFSIEVTTVNDTSAADRDALTFGVRTASTSGGNINAVAGSFLPGGGQTLLMLSNTWLLAQVIRPRLATALGRPLGDFDVPCRLNRPVPAPGGQGTLTNLEARVIGNRIRVDGRATASDTGWSAVSNFHFFIDLALAGGSITVTSSTPQVDTDVSLEWWVWLLSLGLGGLFGGIVGAIVGAIVPAVVEAVAEGIADDMLGSAITNAIGGIPTLPLGPLGSGITLSQLILDDLELRGPVQRALQLPIVSQGHHVASGGFTLDLDQGVVHGAHSNSPKIDLDWDPAAGLDARNHSGFSVSGSPYAALTPLQLRAMGLAGTHLGAASVPLSYGLPLFGGHREVVLGVRTNLGRLAKVRAWRDPLQGGALHLHWVTYDTPIPQLDIALRWSITERAKEGLEYISGNFAACTRSEVSRRATLEAWPRLVVFPVDYQWCLCGQVLEPGEGEVTLAGGVLRYTLQGRQLTVDTEMGQALDCELCVSAIDARGRELFSCMRLSCEATDTVCGPGRIFRPKPRLELIPCDPLFAIDLFEAVNSPRVTEQLVKALQQQPPAAAPLK